MHLNRFLNYTFILLVGACFANSVSAATNSSKQLPVVHQPAPPPAPPSLIAPLPPAPPVIYDSPAPPPEPPIIRAVAAPPPKIPSLAEWLKTDTVKVEPSELIHQYQRLLTDKLIAGISKPASGESNESDQARYKDALEIATRTAKQGYLQAYDEFIDTDGSFWIFAGTDNSAGPDRVVQVSFPNPKQYVMQISMRCIEIDDLCKKMADKYFKSMAIPPPRTHSWEAGYQWLIIRTQQPCLMPGPLNMRAPQYPANYIKDDKEKEVRIRFATDACGIPISVRIEKTSGNRSLDKAAINAVWRWRVKLPEARLSVPLYSLREFSIPVKFIPPMK